MVAALIRRGHDVTLYASDAGTIDVECHAFKTSMTIGNAIRITPSMLRADFKGFDVIHLHNYYTCQNLITRLKAGNTPIVLQPHGSFVMYDRSLYPNPRKLQAVIDGPWRWWFLKKMDRVICVSGIEERQARELGIENTVKIPNGINMREYENLPPRGFLRDKLGIPTHEKIVLYIGRNHRLKGISSLVIAYSSIEDKTAWLVMVGTSDTIVEQGGVISMPPLYGRDKLAALVDADVFVLPSRYDVFGITALEALACGTPTVMTSKCGVTEYLNGEVNQRSGMVESIDACLKSENIESQRQKRMAIARRFDWDIIVGKVEEVYHGL